MRRQIQYSDTSPFLGILEGKRRARVEKAKAERKKEEEEAKRQTFSQEYEAAKNGYDPAKTQGEQAILLEQTKQAGDKSLYSMIGAIVVVVMIGLFFIKKRT